MEDNTNELNKNSATPDALTDDLLHLMDQQKTVPQATELDKSIEQNSPVEVNDIYGGRVFLANRDQIRRFTTLQMRELMEVVGFKYDIGEDGESIEALLMPDPVRIKAATTLNDIPILFSSDNQGNNSRISANEYASIVASRYHPVGDSTLSYYSHDITVDHLPAVIVCGEDLFKIFETGTQYFEGEAHAYDSFTSSITSAIRCLFEGNMEQYEMIIRACIGILNGYENGNPRDKNGTGVRLNAAIHDGLKRLNIDIPTPTNTTPK